MSAFQLVCVFCIHYSHHSLREENQEVAPDLFLSVSAVMTLVTELCKKKKGVWETSVKIPQMHQKMRKEKWRVTCYMTSVLCLQEKKRTHPEKPLVELNDFLVVRSIRARNVNCNLKESTEQFPRPHIWNSLPQDLRFRNCSTLSSFKARLKTILFSVFPPQLILIPSFCYSQCVCVCVCVSIIYNALCKLFWEDCSLHMYRILYLG